MVGVPPPAVNPETPVAKLFGQFPRNLAGRTSARLRREACAWFAPPVCVLCQGDGQYDAAGRPRDLCPHCQAALPRLASPCLCCALPGPRDIPHTPLLPGVPLCIAAYAYAEPVAQLVRDLKFAGTTTGGRLLGGLLAETRQAAAPLDPQTWLVPLPLHRERFVERGYNQSRLLADAAARTLGLPVLEALVRPRATRRQSSLDAAMRQRNLQQAFALAPGRRGRAVAGRRLALVDDVLTTGSSATAAVRVLQAAGAASVEVWVAARALAEPPPEGSFARPPWPIC